MAGRDAKRLGGELPNSSRRQAGCCWRGGPRRRRGDQYRGTALHVPAELVAPALACGNGRRLDRRRRPPSAAVALDPVHRRPTCRRRCSTVNRPGPVVGDGSRNPGRRCPSSASTHRRLVGPGRRRQGGAAGDGRQRTARRARRRRRRRRRGGDADRVLSVRRQSCTAASGSSFTRPSMILRRIPWRARHQAHPARRPFDEHTTMGPLNNEAVAAKMDEQSTTHCSTRTALTGAPARRLSHEPVLGATVLSGCPRDARVSTEETFGRWARGFDQLARAGDRAGQRVALWPAGGDLHRDLTAPGVSPTGYGRAG